MEQFPSPTSDEQAEGPRISLIKSLQTASAISWVVSADWTTKNSFYSIETKEYYECYEKFIADVY